MSKLREAFFESLETPRQLSRKIWLCRYPVVFATFLILIGPLGVLKGTTILGNGFLIGKSSQMAAITIMTLISATLLIKQMTLVFQQAHERFSDITPSSTPIQHNWSWLKTVFLCVAGLSLPFTCWIHSMHQSGGDFSDDPEMSFGKGLLGILLGVLLYFLLYVVSATSQYVLESESGEGPILTMPILESIRRSISFRFQRLKSLFMRGHFELFSDFVMLLVFYLVFYGYTLEGEMTPEDMFTSPFFLILTMTLLSMILSATSYFLDYYRAPTLVVVMALVFGGYFFSDFDHRFPVVRIERKPSSENREESQEPPLTLVASRDAGSTENALSDDWLIVVAPGGGIHASAWTGQVLSGLHERYQDAFKSRLKLVSAVSGGSVGSMFYLDHFVHLDTKDSTKLDRFHDNVRRIQRRSSTSSLEALAWGAAFPDAARLFFGNWIQEDRGMVQERRWLRRMDIEGKDYGPTIYDWKRKADQGLMPYVVFNATEAETGRRVLFSTYQFHRIELNQSVPYEARAIDFLTIANEQFDLPISTAVRLSATFPYAAAAAMPAKDTLPLGHIVDGGYVDNEGLLTALDFIRMEESIRKDGADKSTAPNAKRKRRYVIVRIIHTPPVEDHLISPTDPGLSGSGWEYASFGPLMAMSNVRATSQRERGEIELTLLKESLERREGDKALESDSQVISVMIQFTPPAGYQAPPLNWRLSPRQRAAYSSAWESLTQEGDALRRDQILAATTTSPSTDPVADSPITKSNDGAEFEGLEWFEQNLRPH